MRGYGKRFRIISSGNKTAIGSIPTIGEYWLKLDSIIPKDETARDVEAYFMLWSFESGYFQMACGLLSSPFDLFTFMGIPTVSIGLGSMVGESRHTSLAKEGFKRVNVQYDQPRHPATAYIKPRGGSSWCLMMCPFWDGECPNNVTKRAVPASDADKKKMRDQTPGLYKGYDQVVLGTALSVACQRYMRGAETVSFLKSVNTVIIGTHSTRFAYPTKATSDQRNRYFKDMKALDEKDLAERKRSDSLQEPKEQLLRYETTSKADWQDILTTLGGEEEYGDSG
ncbi:hypothetical protein F5X97DRAFT_318060 [Nemania serpens]|nr:hypothetical protein F5X97DRAFT_318060 [Nemania serpens]